MHPLTRSVRSLFAVAALSVFAACGHAQQPAGTFVASPTLDIEARTLIRLLEEVHYNRDAVSSSSYAEVIPDYMAALDGQHLFFLDSDKQSFIERNKPDSLYWTITSMGKIDPAYSIFTVYQKRVTDRVAWIQEALKKDFDFKTNDTYVIDRAKAVWPNTAADADTLWEQRLRFELIKELLNKKPIDEAKKVVSKRYDRLLKNMSDIESSDVSEMFLGSITRLYDPHSTYFSADTYEDFGIQMRLQLVGIGALLGLEEDQCVIKDIIPGGPADLDKQLKANDKIVAVAQDGAEPVEIIGMKLRKIVDMIRGNKGTRVRLIIEPSEGGGSATRKEVVLIRNVVNLDSSRAHAAIFEVPDAEGNISPIGVISLPTFYGPDISSDGKAQNSATKDIEELIVRLNAAKIKGLVLDLRRNGGGLLSEAISLTGLFIKDGPVVQVRSYSGEIKVDDDRDSAVTYDGPLSVLVDRFSASASEIVAGALQNYGRAVIVGDSSTHGKGTVQTVLELRNLVPQLARDGIKSGATKLTVQKFYLPNGASTQLKGVVPDIILPSIDDYLPIGESDLPHALAWDSIPSSRFDGRPLTASMLSPLAAASAERQKKLPEFSYLRRNIDWFKTRQEQKAVSLNFDARKQQKESDLAFKKTMKTERKQLAAGDYKFNEVMLAPPAPPRPKLDKKDDDNPLDEDDADLSTDENLRYPSVDIPLREALRVVIDLLKAPATNTAVGDPKAHAKVAVVATP
ncbi:carboxy terminal-processing peptidase [Rariglobus hedericola]|uniref:Tail-specific protease n=1 Tax=Rariglobus hedericola TaxID=2597822 RepID=A0A556QPA9_9BACT|nr:carboxy terminal-processing peptidase [Rariglobus hedericola]TSJ78471.1 tail-specific protease [Rariglobus hedericola]